MGRKFLCILGGLLIICGMVIRINSENGQAFCINNIKESIYAKPIEYNNATIDLNAGTEETDIKNEDIDIDRKETIKIISIGDIMMHSDQISCGLDRSTGSYNYDKMFSEVMPYLKNGDVTIGNLEFTMAGKEKGYTGYPMFNSPSEIADAIKKAGIDVVSTANNHSLDRRFYGVEHTIDVLNNRNILHTGTYKTKEDSDKILYMTVKDTKIAFLSYTYGTNGIKTDKGKDFSVNYISEYKINTDIEKARSEGAEIICVSMHWGIEYTTKQVKEQEKLADFLAQNGVDIVLGGHPHVLEPMEIRDVVYDGKLKNMVILYSQGNFVSGQRDRYKETGAIFNIEFEKDYSTDVISFKGLSFIPTWVDAKNALGKTDYRVLPSRRSICMYEKGEDKDLSAADYSKLKRSISDARRILSCDNNMCKEELTY